MEQALAGEDTALARDAPARDVREAERELLRQPSAERVAEHVAVLAIVLLPGRRREVKDVDAETVAMSFARCPGAPYCGHLARVAAWGQRVRVAAARSRR